MRPLEQAHSLQQSMKSQESHSHFTCKLCGSGWWHKQIADNVTAQTSVRKNGHDICGKRGQSVRENMGPCMAMPHSGAVSDKIYGIWSLSAII